MSSSTDSKIVMEKTVISTIGSVAAASMVVRSVAREYLPSEFQDYLYFGLRNFIKLSRQLTIVIYEFDGFQENEIYNATQLYLGSRISLQTNRLKITKNSSDKNINDAMEINGEGESIIGESERHGREGICCMVPRGQANLARSSAMANYLNFDIYDLELTDIMSNWDLRRLLVATANRSILVVEDIDCSVELHDRADAEEAKALDRENYPLGNHGVTLSGFLNFIDGLWSSCGEERIIIFTTNRKDKLDPALLQPGRMDVHINMSYCTPSGFRLLASNYLGIKQHSLFEEIEESIIEVVITPAEVAEQLLKDDDPDIALGGLIEFFDVKRKENEVNKAKAKEREEFDVKECEKNKNGLVMQMFNRFIPPSSPPRMR
ncbi:hypothetical protein L1987_36872 [Smallanthus sonchifolius]|uniref:Uncharacterized protein n=1 Tax=Smallanthus sonchifolius TaxID=185202 RepID=A0ACB9HEC6_9ASTR|nr:hypothetical protein L1987_36872 [Smallanthus sonchifolius]